MDCAGQAAEEHRFREPYSQRTECNLQNFQAAPFWPTARRPYHRSTRSAVPVVMHSKVTAQGGGNLGEGWRCLQVQNMPCRHSASESEHGPFCKEPEFKDFGPWASKTEQKEEVWLSGELNGMTCHNPVLTPFWVVFPFLHSSGACPSCP